MDYFDLIAPIYDWFSKPPEGTRLHRLLRLPTEGWLLDAGGGTGRVSYSLRNCVGQVLVNDLSHRMLKKAGAKALNPVRARVEDLPYPDGCFGRILVVDSLHHFSDQGEAIRNLLRVLKPGGRLVIEEFDLSHKAVRLLAIAEKIMLMRSRFLKPEEIRAMITSNGFPARIERDGYAAWIIADKI